MFSGTDCSAYKESSLCVEPMSEKPLSSMQTLQNEQDTKTVQDTIERIDDAHSILTIYGLVLCISELAIVSCPPNS